MLTTTWRALISEIRELYSETSQTTGVNLVEPTFVVLADFIEHNEKEAFLSKGVRHVYLKPLPLSILR